MSVARKIAYNAVINAGAKITSTVLALVAIAFITRYLGAEGFGKYSVALAFFSFFGALADLGLYSIATREISRKGANAGYIMGNVFSLRLLISLGVFLCTFLFVWFLPYQQDVKMAILISSLGFFFASSYTVLNGIFQKNLVMDRVALVELSGKIIQVSLVAGVVFFDLGFLAFLWAFAFNMMFNFLGVYLLSRRYLSFSLSWNVCFWKKFLRESFPMGIAAIVTFIYFKFDTILLSFFQSAEAVGIYAGAYKVIENVVFFPAMFIGLTLPLLSRHIFEKEKFEFLVNKLFKVFALLVFPLIVGVWFIAEEIMLLIGGEAFFSSGQVLRVLILSLGFIFFSHILNAVLLAANQQKKLMYVLGICAFFNVTLNLFIIPRYSYMGAAVMSAVTEFLVLFLSGWLCYSSMGFLPRIHELGRIVLSVSCMGVFLYFFSEKMTLFLLVPLSAVVYAASILLMRAVQHRELRNIFFDSEK